MPPNRMYSQPPKHCMVMSRLSDGTEIDLWFEVKVLNLPADDEEMLKLDWGQWTGFADRSVTWKFNVTHGVIASTGERVERMGLRMVMERNELYHTYRYVVNSYRSKMTCRNYMDGEFPEDINP